MTFISVIFALAFYAATLILVGGLGFKIWQFWRTPAPLKIPVTPAPVTRLGVGVRIIKEVALFASLFKSNKWTWMFGVLFHAALLVVVLRHLRYFTEPVWLPIALIQPFGVYAGFAMLAGLALLFARRLLVPRVRYITGFSDYLMLVLLFFIGFSGPLMKFVSRPPVIPAKGFFLGLLRLDWQTLPTDFPLMVHLTLVLTLMVVFPFSKLLHAPGLFFAPSRTQVDNAREKRHLVPWVARVIDDVDAEEAKQS